MKTLIIAAGDGERLGEYTKNKPKPLIKILGKSILYTTLAKCRRAGLKNFIIVTGYLGKKIKKAIDRKKYNVEFIDNSRFNKENGYSVLCARNILKNENNFLLLMADHVFDFILLKKLIGYKNKLKKGCAVCIDKNLENIFDLSEATKIYEEGGKILNIGKELKNYNAVDTGFFLCTPDVFKALGKSIGKGFAELSDGMKLLSKEGKLFSINISGNFWLDIDTKRDLEYAKRYQ